ncbi:hypothetical protein [Tardiphaga sp. P9-11]|uniref:hypothetical protein n=1 Tax=Tardiphaga sp. P9-11 TaxID=2024614 RepID=UPI0011F1A382|nr:hypothetical protein [Tardiphaga sp. P9-11]KAA0069976.1 hypothetical protein CIW50_27800 [Tardiphaga sp. P9-11]
MAEFILFGLSVTLSLAAWGAVCRRYIWPRIRGEGLSDACSPLLYFHLFRFVGASFLIPGVAGPGLPHAFAAPGAYGDLIAVALAWIALALLRTNVSVAALWIFNVWGAIDLLYAFYGGIFDPAFHPAALGATFYIPTVGVPFLMCTHVMMFMLLVKAIRNQGAGRSRLV